MMKKFTKWSFVFAVLAMVSGVFYREFTKFNDFTGTTALGYTHVHLFTLGAMFLLIAGLISEKWTLKPYKSFRWFQRLFLIGLPFMTVMFYVRGILQVLGTELTRMQDAAISGIAGLSHIMLAAGIVAFYLALKKAIPQQENAN